ncbi:helix-turn-helix domain-containing protein [Kineosporia babensis]|uniref:Helix-turn-helix domain-containing protein n=1 Tax=Kineosporia babensis TaxID=499548 RepID=A0A9X1NEW7_9ACTN|nr:helix-turn-helix domain-containing protein [Kineosporia babensis]MCD5312800.1 helix-turn-helix domain-containing protein [Kineosporia babensis]
MTATPTLVPHQDNALLEAVIEQAPTPLWVIAAQGHVQLVNQAAVFLLGYTDPGELLGRPSHCTLHETHPDGSQYPQENCPIVGRSGSGPRGGTEWFTTRSGRPVPVVWSTRSLGSTGATLLSFEDASDRGTGEKQRSIWNGRQAAQAADTLGGRTRAQVRDELFRQVHEQFRDPEFGVARLARAQHMSVRSVQVLFAEVGRTPGDEIRAARLEFARRLLERGVSVRSACYESGFNDQGTFTRAFRRRFGDSPTGFVGQRS